MKKFFFIFLIGAINLFAQTAHQEIEKDFTDYSKLMVERNVEKAIDYINPKLFTIISKKEMITLLESLFNIPELDIKLFMPKIESYGNLLKIEGVNYVKMQVITPIEMKLNSPEFTDEMIPFYLTSMEQEFGKGNVTYDEKSKTFKISSSSPVIASSTDQNKNWKFITIDNEEMNLILEKIIPTEVLK